MADPLDRFVPGRDAVVQPLMERLLDAEPELGADPPARPVDELRRLREAVRRDLEALLNTRRPSVPLPADLPHLRNSLVDFGIDGSVGTGLATPVARTRFARAIERRIAIFETRLTNVEVVVLSGSGKDERSLRMRIEANFRIDAAMPPIRLVSTVDPSTNRVAIEDSDD